MIKISKYKLLLNKYAILIVCIFVIIFSCKKETSNYNRTYDILYTDFNPDIVITMPTADTSISKQIDIDGDSLYDFTIEMVHGLENSFHQSFDTYDVHLNGLDSLFFISRSVYADNNSALDSTKYVSDKYYNSSGFRIFYDDRMYELYCNTLSTKNYIGFYKCKNNKKYYGWIRAGYSVDNKTLTIYDCAINRTANDSIRAGFK